MYISSDSCILSAFILFIAASCCSFEAEFLLVSFVLCICSFFVQGPAQPPVRVFPVTDSLVSERRVQICILKVVRQAITSEAQLISGLLQIFIREEPNFNLIHISTILSSVGSFSGFRDGIFFDSIFKKSIDLIATETRHLRAAISVIQQWSNWSESHSQLGDSVEKFILINIDSNEFIELANLTCAVCSRFEVDGLQKLISAYLSVPGRQISLRDAPLIAKSKGFRLCRERLAMFPPVLAPRTICCLIDASPRWLVPEVVARCDERGFATANTQDLIQLAPFLEGVFAFLYVKFVHLPLAFVRNFLHCRKTDSENLACVEESLDQCMGLADANYKRITQGLGFIVKQGARPSLKIVEKAKNRFKNSLDLLFLLASIGYKMDYSSGVKFDDTKSPNETAKYLLMCVWFGWENSSQNWSKLMDGVSVHLGMALIVNYGESHQVSQLVAKTMTNAIDRFVPCSPIDAMHWMMVVKRPSENSFAAALRILENSADFFVPGAIRAAKRMHSRLLTLPEVQAVLLAQVNYMDNANELIELLELVVMDIEPVLKKIEFYMFNEQVSLLHITQILASVLTKPVLPCRYESFMSTLHAWLLPRIPKLSLSDIESITNALEDFEQKSSALYDILDTPTAFSVYAN